MKKSILFIICVALFVLNTCSVASSDNGITCEFTVPESAQVGKECTVSYTFTGGSGNYTNMYISVAGIGNIASGGSRLSLQTYTLENNTGTLTFICPGGSSLGINFYCHDSVTGEDYWKPYNIPLDPNPDFPVTFSYDRDKYYVGDSITISYEIGGPVTTLTNAKVLWGLAKKNYSPEIPVDTQIIDSTTGTTTYETSYGDYVMLFLLAEDEQGNIIYGQSKTIRLQAITPQMAQKLPDSLVTIEAYAFDGTSFRVIEIPALVSYIDDHAFDGSRIRLIVGHNEYVKQYCLDHGIDYYEP